MRRGLKQTYDPGDEPLLTLPRQGVHAAVLKEQLAQKVRRVVPKAHAVRSKSAASHH
jgi:hypothetical protein